MAKKREDGERGKKSAERPECNLDGDYLSPLQSYRDITVERITSVVTRSRYLQSLLVLTVFGFFLRFYNLGGNSLWLDEASTNTFAVMSVSGIWQATASGEFNPPLFYWIEHFMLMAGNNEVILRFIPALLGGLTVPLIYYAGKEFMDRNVGIIAAAAFAFSPFLVFYSQEARAYSMVLFFVTAAVVFYFKAIKSSGELKNWILFGVLSALAFWSHFYAGVIIAALFLYALMMNITSIRKNIPNIRMIALTVMLFIFLCLPLILPAIQLFAARTASAPAFGIQGPGIIAETFRQISGFSDIAMVLLLILFVVGVLQAFYTDAGKGIFLVTLTALTFVISFVLSYTMPMVPRYLIFFTVIFFIGVALSYKVFFGIIHDHRVVYGLIAFLVVLNAPMLASYYSGPAKDDWRGFSAQIRLLTKPGDLVVAVPGYIAQPLDYYYSNASDQTFESGAYAGKDLEAITAAKGNNTVYYIVTSDIEAANPGGDVLTWLKKNTKPLGQNTGIYLFVSG